MLSYLAFLHHGIEAAGNPHSDGQRLAQSCIDQLVALNDPKQFPPRLLILLASPAYLDSLKSQQLLNGVFDSFEKAGHRSLELIGCSVAAVFFNRHIYREGALLVCLASRLLKAKVRASLDVSNDPDKAINSLLRKLDLLTDAGELVHSFANRTLFTLFPGFGDNKYLAPDLHELLRDQLRASIAVFGGVSSADDPQRSRSGILFANRKIYRKAVVAASIECGAPFGISLSQGLTDTGHTVNIAELDPQDRHVVRSFREGRANEVMEQLATLSPMPLLSNLPLDRDPLVDMPAPAGEALRLPREVSEGEPLRSVALEPGKMLEVFRSSIKRSMERAWLLNPIAGLGFRCAGLLRHSERLGLNLEYESALVEHDLSLRDSPYEKPFVGGFVDGEVGVDRNGKSALSTWGSAALIFGDELHFRTPVYRGFEKLAKYAGMNVAATYREAMDRLTTLVYDVGFSGALLSFCVGDEEQDALVPQSASGARFQSFLNDGSVYPLDGDDLLAVAVREKEARFIADSRKERCASMVVAAGRGIVSQYVMPLIGIQGQVTGVLQIDLGDLSYDTQLYETEKTVLRTLCNIASAGINRTFNWQESKIIRKLDQALNASLSAETIKQGLQEYLERSLDAFGLKDGHVRVAQEEEHRLRLVAGVGNYFDESRKIRREIDFIEVSPTARSFRNEEKVVVNDARHNESHQQMCRLWEHEAAFHQRLCEVASYANIPFKSERDERGTINLLSPEPWFFMPFHQSALVALGERLGFLLEMLRRKERETFLLGVSPQFSQLRDLDNDSEVMTNEIGRFAKAVKADIASLCLWDDDRQCYILRAQVGWSDPNWVNAAYYTNREFWTGTTALAGRPRHIPDLFAYYQRFPSSTKRYVIPAFGQELSTKFTVEAIALQLRIADQRLGVLTLYRRRPGAESGFLTTDTALLQQGADNFASLIGILRANRRERWRKQEHARRQEVYDTTVPDEGAEVTESFEERACRQVLKSYRAVRASIYKVKGGETSRLIFRKSFRRDPRSEQITEVARSPDDSEFVDRALYASRHNDKELQTERIKLTDGESYDPQKSALAGLVRRACIPLISEKQLVGVLSLHWSFDHKQVASLDYQHGEGFLRMLGEVVGSAYRMHLAKVQAESKLQEATDKLREGQRKLAQSEDQTRYAVQATSAYVLQHHHELRNLVSHMMSLLMSLRALRKDVAGEEELLLEELTHKVKEGTATLKRMAEIGRKMAKPSYERLSLKNLMAAALQQSRVNYAGFEFDAGPPDISDDYSVWVAPSLIQIAFVNLLDNAIKAMKDCDPRSLSIRAMAGEGRREVTVVISDTGVGMSEDVIEQILNEFFTIKGRISVGVVIAKMILGLHGGRLSYSSVKGDGTQTIIVLPLDYGE